MARRLVSNPLSFRESEAARSSELAGDLHDALSIAPQALSRDVTDGMEAEMMTEGQRMLSGVEEVARRRAREKVVARFHRSDNLEEIDTWAPVLRQRLEIAEAQLRTATHGKLFSLKRVDDFVAAMPPLLEDLRERFTDMRALCEVGRTTLKSQQRLRRVGFAQRNLHRTLRLLELFSEIPRRAASQIKLLKSGSRSVGSVCQQVLAMEQWRDDILSHLQLRHEQRQRAASTGIVAPRKSQGQESLFARQQKRRSSLAGREHVEADPGRLIKLLSVHFDDVLTLSALLREKLLEAANETATFAREDPAYLEEVVGVVLRLDAIELRKQGQRADRGRNGSIEEEPEEDEDAANAMDAQRILRLFCARMAHGAETYVVTVNSRHIFELAQEGYEQDVPTTLRACSLLIEDVGFVTELLGALVPPEFDAVATFENACLQHLERQISRCYHADVIDGLSPGELLMLVEWMREYGRLREERELEPSRAFVDSRQQLLNRYLDKTKTLMSRWFANMNHTRRDQAFEGAEGHLMTTFPEDFFHALHVMLQVAKQKLGGVELSLVIRDCLNVLEGHQMREARDLASEQNVSMTYLCRVVNDNDRLQQKCDEYLADMSQFLAVEVMPAMDEFVEDLSSQLAQNSLRIVGLMVEHVFAEMEDMGIQKGLFKRTWVSGDEEIMPTVVLTILDYASDFHTWLVPFYFSKFMVQAVRRCSRLVLDAFSLAGEVADWPYNRVDAASRINADATYIRETFTTCAYAEHLGAFDFEDGLLPMFHLAAELQKENTPLAAPASPRSGEGSRRLRSPKIPKMGSPKGGLQSRFWGS